MDYRSTNPTGFVHFVGDVVSNVHSSHGVSLSGGSTGGVVESEGDDTGASLLVQAKGAARVTVGNTSNTVTLAGSSQTLNSTAITLGTTASSILIGASTAACKGIFFKTSSWTCSSVVSSEAEPAVVEVTFESTTFDVSPGDVVQVSFKNLAAPLCFGGYRLSTVATSRLTAVIYAPGSTTIQGTSGTIQVGYIDMT